MNLVGQNHPALVTVCAPVTSEEMPALRMRLTEMRSLMNLKKGIGLAAPQVGDTRRYFVWAFGVVVNPELLDGQDKKDSIEGCLSYPGVLAKVERYSKIRVRYRDHHFEVVEKNLEGLPAIIFQHELNHLDGLCAVKPGGQNETTVHN